MPNTSDVSRKIVRNTMYNVVSRAWGVLVGLVLSPYIIHTIGGERFGLWTIIGTVTGYFGLLDLGVETAFVKYIAEFYEKRDFQRINKLVNTGIVFYACFMLLLLPLMAVFLDPLCSFLRLNWAPRDELFFAFLGGATIFCLANMASPLVAIQNGLQRMDLSNKVNVGMSILTLGTSIFFLAEGYGLRGLVLANALVLCCNATINACLACRLIPQFRLDPRLFSGQELGRLFSYGYKLQVSRFAALVSFQADNLLISHFLGVGLVTYYQLGTSVIQQARMGVLLMISALIPAVSQLAANNDRQRLAGLFLRGSKYLTAVSIPVTFLLVVLAPVVMTTWMGEGYQTSALVIRVLAVGYCAATVTGVASSITAGTGLTRLDMKFGLVLSTMNLLLGILLIIQYGLIGVLVATAFSLTLSSLFFMRLFSKEVSLISVRGFLRLLSTPALCCLAPAAAVLGITFTLGESSLAGSRVANGCCLVACGVIFMFCYGFTLLKCGYFDRDELLLLDRIPVMRRFLPRLI